MVKGQTFSCHRLSLHLASGYFKELFDSGEVNEDDVIDLDIPTISPSTFQVALRYMHCSTVELDKHSVCDVLNAADALSMPALRRQCIDYMLTSVGPDNCFKYWRFVESVEWSNESERKLSDRCRSLARTTFWRLATKPRPLADASDDIVEMLLRDEDLQVGGCCGQFL